MPAPGDQHNITANPFEEVKPRVSEFTASEIATLQSRLEKQLGPEYLSARAGPSGQKVHYIAAEKCIALANEVFGFNGWSSSIQNIQVDFVDENPQTLKISLGLSVIVRVTLRDGTFHEDIGYGHIENCKGKAAAFEKAKKEGTTDALKRALRSFGNVLGNCIYDKDYLSKVTKMKVAPTKFDEDNLHRHSDFAVKKEPEEPRGIAGGLRIEQARSTTPAITSPDSLDDEFGDFEMADFNIVEEGHPDEVILPPSHGVQAAGKPLTASRNSLGNYNDQSKQMANNNGRPMQPPSRPLARSVSAGNPSNPPITPNQMSRSGPTVQGRPQPQNQNQQRPPNHPNATSNTNSSLATGIKPSTTFGQNGPTPPNGTPSDQVSFFSAKSVSKVAEDSTTPIALPPNAAMFNPKAESPSIRKTPGIDHSASKPVAKNLKHVPAKASDEGQPKAAHGGFGGAPGASGAVGVPRPAVGSGLANSAINGPRQIGAPGSIGSPLANKGGFRPPTVKRPQAEGGGRPPLSDVSTNGGVGVTGPDAKRVKMN